MSAVKPKSVQRAIAWNDSVEEGKCTYILLWKQKNIFLHVFFSAYRFQIAGYKDENEYAETNPTVAVSSGIIHQREKETERERQRERERERHEREIQLPVTNSSPPSSNPSDWQVATQQLHKEATKKRRLLLLLQQGKGVPRQRSPKHKDLHLLTQTCVQVHVQRREFLTRVANWVESWSHVL